VLAGDLNASFIRPKPTVIDKPFMEDIVEMEFVLPDKYPRDSTFHHFNGYSVSQIDYHICRDDTNRYIFTINLDCTNSFAPIAKFRNKRVQRLSP
jgi:hypothetical protein